MIGKMHVQCTSLWSTVQVQTPMTRPLEPPCSPTRECPTIHKRVPVDSSCLLYAPLHARVLLWVKDMHTWAWLERGRLADSDTTLWLLVCLLPHGQLPWRWLQPNYQHNNSQPLPSLFSWSKQVYLISELSLSVFSLSAKSAWSTLFQRINQLIFTPSCVVIANLPPCQLQRAELLLLPNLTSFAVYSINSLYTLSVNLGHRRRSTYT